jgi:surface antigen
MRWIGRRVSRCVPAFAGLALVASTAAASPLSAAVEQATDVAEKSAPQSKHAILKSGRIMTDRAAALESVQIALARVADGSTYIWHRPNGILSGSIKPTITFRRANGELCRHVIVEMSSEEDFRVVEGIACRETNGQWRLEG